QRGYEVKIFDKGNNPYSENNWKMSGATYGGENARMYSITEADNYNEKNSEIYSDMMDIFDTDIKHSGWKAIKEFSSNEMNWVKNFKSVDPVNANAFSNDIYTLNIASGSI